MKQVTMNVDDEFAAAGDLIAILIADISAKKDVATIAADALPKAIAVVGAYQNFAADIKKVDNQLYLLKVILGALEPAAPVAAV